MNYSNNKLAGLIEAQQHKVDETMNKIFQCFDRNDIKFNDCVLQLGENNRFVKAHKKACDRLYTLENEAIMRVGPQTYRSMLPCLLREQGRKNIINFKFRC